jgi:RNA polymerase sigma-70 factor (ECF subfamily)
VRCAAADTDRELVARLKAGDEDAFDDLVRRYHQRLVRLAGTFVGRPDLAEDVAQETWLAVLNGIARFEGRSALQSWLFAICANRARTVAVREKRSVPVDVASDSARPLPALADRAAERAQDADLVAAVRRAILDLPEAQRRVVAMCDVEGMSPAQVCGVLSISEANQRVLLHRGRAGVRARLAGGRA